MYDVPSPVHASAPQAATGTVRHTIIAMVLAQTFGMYKSYTVATRLRESELLIGCSATCLGGHELR
jgi:hypothetical protein